MMNKYLFIFLIIFSSCSENIKKLHMLNETEEAFHLSYINVCSTPKDKLLICISAYDLYNMSNVKMLNYIDFCDVLCENDKEDIPLAISCDLYERLKTHTVSTSERVDSIYGRLNIIEIQDILDNGNLSISETRYLGSLLWKDNILLSYYLGERKWYVDK